ncbi:iron ABC transporter ATP-binding protein [methanogenic archaeon mixed culture ISO4-G1]|nr:iron ABC transporter ATP-binding protein [methanogenic archaeon mixed culture ISO4-G1]
MKISVNGISFDYDSKSVLHDVEFKAYEGEVLGILGENGCGKTTLLKCINNLLKPQMGCTSLTEINEDLLDKNNLQKYMDENEIHTNDLDNKEIARFMAVVSQSEYVSFPFTCLDAVKMGRYADKNSYSPAEEREIVYQAMKDAGALEFTNRHVNELSGGELRRVMIARALAQRSEVLLLDEPTLHLDVIHQFELMNLIRDLAHERKLIVIMVTHDMILAARYCDKVIMMKKGSIVDAGLTADVMTQKNIRDIFRIETDVQYDERIGGLNITMIGIASPDEKETP